MRWYNIAITSASGQPVLPASLGGLSVTSLLPNGQVNPAALNVELDIPQYPYHTPDGNGYVRIWGLGLAAIGSAFDLNGNNITVSAGMSKGLPLANPAQQGVLVSGMIFQAFGNWVSTDQTIDLIIAPSTGTNAAPMNFVLNWPAGTALADALKTTLSTALPNATLNISISPRLTLSHDEVGYYGTLAELSAYLHPVSQAIITDAGYAGVSIAYDGQTVRVADFSTAPTTVKAIAFQDLLGQPTWKEPLIIQAKVVMRGDLDIGDVVSLPKTLVTNNAGAFTSLQGAPANSLTFSGNYIIQRLHHYGNFRQPDAASWNTTIDMTQQVTGGQQ